MCTGLTVTQSRIDIQVGNFNITPGLLYILNLYRECTLFGLPMKIETAGFPFIVCDIDR